MIGFGWALAHAVQVRRLVMTNTAVFPMPTSKKMPWQIALGRDWRFGEWMVRGLNAFALGAAWLGVETRLPRAVRRAYLAPYNSWANRISIIRFMQDIPCGPGDRAWPLLEATGKALPDFADRPVFIGWGCRILCLIIIVWMNSALLCRVRRCRFLLMPVTMCWKIRAVFWCRRFVRFLMRIHSNRCNCMCGGWCLFAGNPVGSVCVPRHAVSCCSLY